MKFSELKNYTKFIYNDIIYIKFTTSYFQGNAIVVKPYQEVNYTTLDDNTEVSLFEVDKP